MTEQEPNKAQNGDTVAENALRDLFAHAKPRPLPPPADTEEIRRAVYAEWNAVTKRRVLWRRAGGAVAAAVAASVALLVFSPPDEGPAPLVASVERLQGTVLLGGEVLRLGDAVGADATVTTREGQVSLRLARGGSLRLASDTRLRLASEGSAELLAGALYFDSEGEAGSGPFAVETPIGTLRDVGTQFTARVDGESVELGVRDGRVAVERGADRAEAATGERLVVPPSGAIRRSPLATFGDEWAWVERLAPPFEIDGRRLTEFLDWVGEQTGRTVVFADPETERLAREATLRGSIDLDPIPKLAAVMMLTDLTYSFQDANIVIAPR